MLRELYLFLLPLLYRVAAIPALTHPQNSARTILLCPLCSFVAKKSPRETDALPHLQADA